MQYYQHEVSDDFFLEENNSTLYYRAMEHFLRDRRLQKFKINYGVDFGNSKYKRHF